MSGVSWFTLWKTGEADPLYKQGWRRTVIAGTDEYGCQRCRAVLPAHELSQTEAGNPA